MLSDVLWQRVCFAVDGSLGYEHGVIMDFSRPGKPTDNLFIESFNGSFRDECLNAHWLLSRDDACQKIERWRQDYNHFRAQSAIGNPTCRVCGAVPTQPLSAEFSTLGRYYFGGRSTQPEFSL
jgi:putative transposase